MSSFPIPSRKFLEQIGVRPSKGRGQNFLREAWVVEQMAAELALGQDDLVVEVGPGLGALTGVLLDTSARVVAIEIDEQLTEYLSHRFEGLPLTLVRADARTVSIDQIVPEGRDYDLAANLPYSSAPAILRHFLESDRPPRRSVCMVQREVAERMTASPPDLSILGVAIQVYTHARILFDIPPEAFVPRPKIMSSAILLERRDTVAIDPEERQAFFRLVTAGFAQKRKTILNSLVASLPAEREFVRAALSGVDIDPMRRAETLSIDDWVHLLHALDNDR